MGIVYEKALEYLKKNRGTIAWRVKKHCAVVEKFLNPDEEVIYVFVGQKNEHFYEIFMTAVIVITNKRILIGQKRVVWGSFLSTITPELYNDMQIYQGLIWGRVTIDTVKETIVFSNLSKNGLDDIETNISEFMIEAKKKFHKS